jgi:predicted RNA binding protein YcfA (HicA-like mRNA interferase family)
MSNVVGTERIGQLTGSARTVGEVSLTTDWTTRPLLNETNRFRVNGIDLGANTEHNGATLHLLGDIEVQGRELARRIGREGWVVGLRNGRHLELSHPRADRAVITSAIPSDWRWLRNLHTQMRRTLPPEPKTERTVRHARSKRPLQQRPPQQQPKRPAPVVAAVERPARPRPTRRLPGGPAGQYSPWTAWW